jgi:hypothetical protein
MPLLRGIARTAVVAGTATAVSNRVSRRQAGRWAAKDQQAADQQAYQEQAYQQQAPQQAPPEQPRTSTEQKIAQLKQLGELKQAGVLTEEEFEVQKSEILNS